MREIRSRLEGVAVVAKTSLEGCGGVEMRLAKARNAGVSDWNGVLLF